eukprot:14699487-Alexandrium_andersonii.AAC.1
MRSASEDESELVRLAGAPGGRCSSRRRGSSAGARGRPERSRRWTRRRVRAGSLAISGVLWSMA